MKYYVCRTKDNEIYLLTPAKLLEKLKDNKEPYIIGTTYYADNSSDNELIDNQN